MTKRYFVVSTGLIVLLWAFGLFSDPEQSGNGFWAWRGQAVILLGILSLTWMSAAMLLGIRPAFLDRRLGLDKVYRLHKWAGIGTGVLVFLHWGAERIPKYLVQAGVLTRPGRGGGGAAEDMWLELAKVAGEWGGYILVALVVVALWKRVPFRAFQWVHKAMALVFLAGAYHGVYLLGHRNLLDEPVGWVTLAAAAVGTVAAIVALFNRVGARRRVPAEVLQVAEHENGLLEVWCHPQGSWRGHAAGQFLFATFDRAEGGHPFTIASPWGRDGKLRLVIKPLGDYTRRLASHLRPGMSMVLEGPYGRFDFGDHCRRQVWVAGGIGLTPFLAKLEELAAAGGAARDIDFFYSVQDRKDADSPVGLAELCRKAKVRLHLHVTEESGFLAPREVMQRIKDNTSVWFCGPAGWAHSLKSALCAAGLPEQRFHRELFEFR